MKNRLCYALLLLTALGCALSGQAAPRSWTGATAGLWTNSARWVPVGVPAPTDSVTIAEGTVTITTTATVSALTISGSGFLKVAATGGTDPAVQTPLSPTATDPIDLIVSNDLTISGTGKLAIGGLNQDANATLAVGGGLTLTNSAQLAIYAGPTNATATIESGGSWVTVTGTTTVAAGCWVYPICDQRSGAAVAFTLQDLLVATNAGFDADERGFGRVAGYTLVVGAGTSYYIGGSHGGRAGASSPQIPPPTYGEPATPYLPGAPSGEYSSNFGVGGGAVRIDARDVTLNGTLSADTGARAYGGGSGGSVWLTCRSLQGTDGRVSASGGTCLGHYGSDGGGGRIVLDVEEEITDPAACALAVSARQGINHTGRRAEVGSLWVSKLSLLKALLPQLEGAQIFSPELSGAPIELTPLAVGAKTHLFFNTPTSLTMTGDVAVAADGLLGFGGLGTAATGFRRTDAGTGAYDVTIDGALDVAGVLVLAGTGTQARTTLVISNSLSVTNGGSLYAHAGPTNATTTYRTGGARVTVVDTLTVTSNGWVYPICDMFTGAPVVFAVSNLVVEEGGWVKADEAGFGYVGGVSLAPGLGYNYNLGAGYGGYGGSHNATYGNIYGTNFAPFLPGSPNGTYQPPHMGGGAICIHCSGTATLEGSFTANGNDPDKAATWASGPSGGSIWITARTIVYGDNLTLEAKGGHSNYSSGGGGGRIALGNGVADYFDDFYAEILPVDVSVDDLVLAGLDVSGGVTSGEDGTAVLVTGPGGDKSLNVQGSPLNAGSPTPAYGITPFAHGTVVGCSVPSPGGDPAWNNRSRLACTGYVASNATTEVASGAGTNVDLTLDENLTLTWLWGTREYHFEATASANGSLLVNGSPMGSYDEWVTAGGTASNVTAVADTGYEFVAWAGDVPLGVATSPAIAVVMDVPRAVVAHFASTQAVARAWLGGNGAWFDASGWSPAGIPGRADSLTIAAGECRLTNFAEVASLALSGTAIVRVGAGAPGAASAVTVQTAIETLNFGDAGLRVTGDLTLADSAQLGLGGSDPDYANHLTVGGDLTLGGTAQLAVYAGPTNAHFSFVTGGAQVRVAGTATVGAGCWVHPFSHSFYGGQVRFDLRGLVVADGGGFNADTRGYGMAVSGEYPTITTTSLAPGKGYSYNYGGGYGGYGGNHTVTYGLTYGSPYAPFRPGSPNGFHYNGGTFPNCFARGGGALLLHCGTVTIDGTLTANGGTHTIYGGSSGGGIWLTSSFWKMTLGATAVLQANGGGPCGYGSGGGGGRVAVGIRLSEAQIAQAYDQEVLPDGTVEWTGPEIAEEFPGATFSVSVESGGATGTVAVIEMPLPRSFIFMVR